MRQVHQDMLDMVTRAMADSEDGATFRAALQERFNLTTPRVAPVSDPRADFPTHITIPTIYGGFSPIPVIRLLEMQQDAVRYGKIRPIMAQLTMEREPAYHDPLGGGVSYIRSATWWHGSADNFTDPDSVDKAIDEMTDYPAYHHVRRSHRAPRFAQPWERAWDAYQRHSGAAQARRDAAAEYTKLQTLMGSSDATQALRRAGDCRAGVTEMQDSLRYAARYFTRQQHADETRVWIDELRNNTTGDNNG